MHHLQRHTGNLIVISAPSGAGKTSLVNAVLSCLDNIERSISYTTRAPRGKESEGKDYFFVNNNTFEEMLGKNAFLEHATVFDNHYGTSRGWVESTLRQGKDVILVIDWQGARQIQQAFPHSQSVFIFPPSHKELAKRLSSRNEDCSDTIQYRLALAKQEMSYCHEYDYWILNQDFNQAVEDLCIIINSLRFLARNQSLKELD